MEIIKKPNHPILIIDDEEDALQSYKTLLRYNGFDNIILCSDSREVVPLLSQVQVSLAILDLNMPNLSGQELLAVINEKYPEIPIIIITAVDKIETAVLCMKKGAFDYMIKPVEKSQLSVSINRALEIHELRQEVALLSKQVINRKLQNPEAFSEIITNNETMKSIFRYIEAIAASSKPVLITGESGVGKEAIARAIYKQSKLKGDFVPVNVAGLDDNMFSDTLFGHTKGAFTGADSVRQGLIRNAENGILFLDEIGDMDMRSQVKLLRLLQEKEYSPLGSDTTRASNARIIAATNIDFEEKVNLNQFRRDLYFRLATHHIHIPPLSERFDDLPLLIEHFLDEASVSLNKKKPSVPKELKTLLSTYNFSGNIRELQSMIFDATVRHQNGTLSLSYFREYIQKKTGRGVSDIKLPDDEKLISIGDHFPTLKEIEDFLIKEAMDRSEGNQTIAAQLLGVSQSTLSRRFKTS
jgi:DNA-binding NtrC family response regulator